MIYVTCRISTRNGYRFETWENLILRVQLCFRRFSPKFDNFIVSLLVLWSFLLQCSGQTHQLRSIPIPYDGFTRFKQIIIHHTEQVPSNAEHNLGTVNIRCGHRRGGMSEHSPWFSALEIIVVNLFLVAGHNAMCHIPSKYRLCLWSSCSQAKKRRSTSLDSNSYETQFPCFWIIPMALRRFEMACWVTPNDSTNSSCVLHESSASNASNLESSKLFSFPPPCRSSTSKSPILKCWNHSWHVL